MAGTHKETKQFFTLYNTLDDTKLYLGKEVRSVNLLCFAPHPPLPCASCATSFLLHFDVNCYLLLNRRTVTWSMCSIYAVLSLSEVSVYFIHSDGEFKVFFNPFFYRLTCLTPSMTPLNSKTSVISISFYQLELYVHFLTRMLPNLFVLLRRANARNVSL